MVTATKRASPPTRPAGRTLLGAKRGSFSSHDGTPIAFLDTERKDAPTLLLINGIGASAMAYAYVADAFGDRFRIVCFEYRGLHGSGRPLRGYSALTIKDHARDALALLEHLDIERAHTVGWSMGVQVLLELYRLASPRIESMVLHGGVAGRPFETLALSPRLGRVAPRVLVSLQRRDRLAGRALAFGVDGRWFVPLAVRLGLTHHGIDHALFRELAVGFKDHDLHLLFEMMRHMGEHDARDVLGTIRCPTLVLTGSRDFLASVELARAMVDEIPRATLSLVPGGTHYALVEFPTLINRALANFWSAIAGGVPVAEGTATLERA